MLNSTSRSNTGFRKYPTVRDICAIRNCDLSDSTIAGVNYFGTIVLDEKGNAIHARVFRPSETSGEIKFHSIHVRPSEEGGAVFKKNDPLEFFEY